MRTASRFLTSLLLAGSVTAQPQQTPEIRKHFTALCALGARAMMPEPPDREQYRKAPGIRDYYMFFVDSYAVRALAVAYDLTGEPAYWEACRAWSDRMVRHQDKMIPAGAYYMNYHRKPGESKGQWFVADSGSIAMGVLAAAARAREKPLRDRYLASVRSYLRLVMDNFIRNSGGVTDGYYDKSDQEWWCSTALFAAASLQFHGMTGEEPYRQAGLRAVDWLLDFEYADTQDLYKFEDGAPTTLFYILEAYSSALPFLDKGSARQRRLFERFSQAAEWVAYTQNREGTWNYNPDNWGVKLGGFPSQLLIYLREVPDSAARRRKCLDATGRTVTFEQLVGNCATRALNHFASLPLNEAKFTQKNAFVMLSEAELLAPGKLYDLRHARR